MVFEGTSRHVVSSFEGVPPDKAGGLTKRKRNWWEIALAEQRCFGDVMTRIQLSRVIQKE